MDARILVRPALAAMIGGTNCGTDRPTHALSGPSPCQLSREKICLPRWRVIGTMTFGIVLIR